METRRDIWLPVGPISTSKSTLVYSLLQHHKYQAHILKSMVTSTLIPLTFSPTLNSLLLMGFPPTATHPSYNPVIPTIHTFSISHSDFVCLSVCRLFLSSLFCYLTISTILSHCLPSIGLTMFNLLPSLSALDFSRCLWLYFPSYLQQNPSFPSNKHAFE